LYQKDIFIKNQGILQHWELKELGNPSSLHIFTASSEGYAIPFTPAFIA
jgi:hypothetical protein